MVIKAKYIPERGDIVWINFSPTKGHEQAHKRPALVLSPRIYNQKSGMMIACPITSNIKQYPFEVELKTKRVNGAILANHVRSLDWQTRHIVFIHKAPFEILNNVQEHIIQLLTE